MILEIEIVGMKVEERRDKVDERCAVCVFLPVFFLLYLLLTFIFSLSFFSFLLFPISSQKRGEFDE